MDNNRNCTWTLFSIWNQLFCNYLLHVSHCETAQVSHLLIQTRLDIANKIWIEESKHECFNVETSAAIAKESHWTSNYPRSEIWKLKSQTLFPLFTIYTASTVCMIPPLLGENSNNYSDHWIWRISLYECCLFHSESVWNSSVSRWSRLDYYRITVQVIDIYFLGY